MPNEKSVWIIQLVIIKLKVAMNDEKILLMSTARDTVSENEEKS